MSSSTTSSVGANSERARSHNRQLVLGRVKAAGQAGRAEIARTSGLSTQAVSNIIADLLRDGLILERGRRSGSRGQPAVQYALDAKGGYGLGIDLRPDSILLALLDLTGTMVHATRVSLDVAERDLVTRIVCEEFQKCLRATGVPSERVLGAGIVMPGPFGKTGIRHSGSDLPGWDDTDAATWFAEALGLSTIVENDANAAAMAERVFGAAVGMESFAFLFFGGKGLGLGIVYEGRPMVGGFGNAGEIGFVPVPASGKVEMLEQKVSRLSIEQAMSAWGVQVEDMGHLEELYQTAHPGLLDWLDRAVEPLSAGITIIENMLDPEAIILGGAMPEVILDDLIGRVTFAERVVSDRDDRRYPRLIRGTSGRMTATLGAAALVINNAVMPVIGDVG